MTLHKCESSDESFPPPTAQQAVSSREKSEAAVSTKACTEVTVSPVAGWVGFIRDPKSFSLTRILTVTNSKKDLQWDSDSIGE